MSSIESVRESMCVGTISQDERFERVNDDEDFTGPKAGAPTVTFISDKKCALPSVAIKVPGNEAGQSDGQPKCYRGYWTLGSAAGSHGVCALELSVVEA